MTGLVLDAYTGEKAQPRRRSRYFTPIELVLLGQPLMRLWFCCLSKSCMGFAAAAAALLTLSLVNNLCGYSFTLAEFSLGVMTITLRQVLLVLLPRLMPACASSGTCSWRLVMPGIDFPCGLCFQRRIMVSSRGHCVDPTPTWLR
jgi:hypothetical protein